MSSTLPAPLRVLVGTSTLLLSILFGACSTPRIELSEWRAHEAVARPQSGRGVLADELAQVERLRADADLEAARRLALELAAEHPADATVLLVASRAESDGMLLLPADDERSRNHAAASSLDYAERAAAEGADTAAARAQLAWALGTTTHLQPMGDRAEHARRTLATARAALELEPEQPTALATLAILDLRLETLPWIASLMASGLPDSSLADAEAFARRAIAARPSRENRLVLAKVLVAAERRDEARTVLREALDAGERFPRDRALEPALRALLGRL